jgi:hypothetical protein
LIVQATDAHIVAACEQGINQHMQVHPVPLVGLLKGEGVPHLAWSWFNNQEAEEVPDLLVDTDNASHPLAVPMAKLRWGGA